MKYLYRSILFITSVLLSIGISYSQAIVKYSERANGHNSPYRVPINEILKSPDVYEGTPIQVVGYLILDWESDAIYVTQSDFTSNEFNKGLWVHINQFQFKQTAKFNGRYVVIDGVFDANDHGHENLWGGAIKEIASLRPYYKSKHK